MGSIEPELVDHDVIIVGAGISGINAAYRLQTEIPTYTYTILENRNAIGGTWDLFRYPGIRSDSDLHTFGFPWRPWDARQSIADGAAIRNYIRESAEQYGIDRRIKYHHKLLAADWSSAEQRWNLTVGANGHQKTFSARFMILSTGYYDYSNPLKAQIPGLENFTGQVIHPQFWPEDLEYTGKKMVVIGSGATAITLLPNLAEKAAHVTMLQRSPSYILPLPAVDASGDFMRRWFPARIAQTFVRWKFLILPFMFFKFCRAFPNAARKIIRKGNEKALPENVSVDPHFNPSYNPWEQRLCVCPNGDFFKSLREGKADVVTDTIKTVTESGITTMNGITLDADIIITATGLKMQMGGGARISTDGQPIDVSKKFIWKGVMLQDVPNSAFVIGYTNASWTLGADATARLLCRIMKHIESNGQSSAVPIVEDGQNMKPQPMLNLNSTYVEKARGDLPQAGDQAPWLPRSNYLIDYWVAGYGSVTKGLKFTKVAGKL